MCARSPADVNAEISTDAAGLGVSRVGLTQHHPGQLHNVLSLPHLKHTQNSCRHDEDGFKTKINKITANTTARTIKRTDFGA